MAKVQFVTCENALKNGHIILANDVTVLTMLFCC